jgi:hypothetical protein
MAIRVVCKSSVNQTDLTRPERDAELPQSPDVFIECLFARIPPIAELFYNPDRFAMVKVDIWQALRQIHWCLTLTASGFPRRSYQALPLRQAISQTAPHSSLSGVSLFVNTVSWLQPAHSASPWLAVTRRMQPTEATARRSYRTQFFALCHGRIDLAAYLVIIARSFGNIFNDVLYLTNMGVIVGHCGSYGADRNIRPQAERNGRQQKLSDAIHKTSPSLPDCGKRKKSGPMRDRPTS